GQLHVAQEPDPEPAAGETLVRVAAVGLCGSDRHWFVEGGIGDVTLAARPLVLGHEVAGVITGGPRAGERVAVDPAQPCGLCDRGRRGRGHPCPAVRSAGPGTVDGGLRTLIAWPGRLLQPVPDEVDDPHATLLEPLGVALHALDLGAPEPGDRAAVIG